MLRAYIDALRRATYEILPDDSSYYGEVPGLAGVWANAATLEACRDELASALQDWVVAVLQLGQHLPENLDLKRLVEHGQPRSLRLTVPSEGLPEDVELLRGQGWRFILTDDNFLELVHLQAWYFQVRFFPRLQ